VTYHDQASPQASGERIYHVPGQRYYDKTQINEGKGERWFCTEQNKKPLMLVGEKRRSKRRPSASGWASFQSTV
jgi:hypothetical protein